jgi:hypothetical protein
VILVDEVTMEISVTEAVLVLEVLGRKKKRKSPKRRTLKLPKTSPGKPTCKRSTCVK